MANLFGSKNRQLLYLGAKFLKTNNTVYASCSPILKPKDLRTTFISSSNLTSSSVLSGSAARAETTCTTQGLSKLQAQELVLRLTTEERSVLTTALTEFESKLMKDQFEGELAHSRWRSKYGRPSKVPRLGDVDPTGTYCPVPEDWLKKKFDNGVLRPSNNALMHISIGNAIPFIGFGFLDNFFMILFGDYIDVYLGSYFCLSTMAAAALGNTFSDVLGIGTAFYVERLANRIGYNPPKMTPKQMDMTCSRNAANFGRVMGVTIGCLLGMFPLLFFKTGKGTKEKDEKDPKSAGDSDNTKTASV